LDLGQPSTGDIRKLGGFFGTRKHIVLIGRKLITKGKHMAWKSTTFKREMLYREIWEEPVTKVAKRYGLSDVGLRKICKRLSIPLPPAGHWAKKAVGKAMPTPKLLPYDGPAEYTSSRDISSSTVANEAEDPEVSALEIFEAQEENRITVSDALHGCHPLVSATRKALQAPFIDTRGMVSPRGNGVFTVSANRQNVHRVLCILNALTKAAAMRNMKILTDSGVT
jgi:hypothetical protein